MGIVREPEKRLETLRIVVEDSLNEIYLFDSTSLKFIFVNRGARSNLGYDQTELYALAPYDIKPEFDETAFRKLIGPLLAGETPVLVFETTHKRKDGTLYDVEVHLEYLSSENPPVFAAFILDITDRKQLERELREAQRMEAIGQLTGGVAHDFNNVMTTILGNAELLQDHVSGDEFADKLADSIVRAVERGASLTQRLLAFARKQSLSPAFVDIPELLDGLSDMLQRTLGETVELAIRHSPDLWTVHIDRIQFENALINLTLNARDAMPEGGRLTIEAVNARPGAPGIELPEDLLPGDYVLVTVSDNGTGMEPEVLDKAFEPFFTTKDVGEGSGLGLSMVYGFVKQSNGHIAIDSEAGTGTTVRLYLPRSENTAPAAEKPREHPAPTAATERILIVEDDPEVLKIPLAALKREGYEVFGARNGDEAIEVLKANGPFDLLFTDVVLPGGMKGAKLSEAAREICPGIKILYTSGYTRNVITNHGVADDGVVLLSKPYKLGALLDRVRDILNG